MENGELCVSCLVSRLSCLPVSLFTIDRGHLPPRQAIVQKGHRQVGDDGVIVAHTQLAIAGEAADLVRQVLPAAVIVEQMVATARQSIEHLTHVQGRAPEH